MPKRVGSRAPVDCMPQGTTTLLGGIQKTVILFLAHHGAIEIGFIIIIIIIISSSSSSSRSRSRSSSQWLKWFCEAGGWLT